MQGTAPRFPQQFAPPTLYDRLRSDRRPRFLFEGRPPYNETGAIPDRVPKIGDRVYWSGDVRHPRREGTIEAVYSERRRAVDELVVDVRWDLPSQTDVRPWGGLSRGLPASRLTEPGWGWIEAPAAREGKGRCPARPRESVATSNTNKVPTASEKTHALRRALGRAIARRRREARLSQESLADACGMHRTLVGAVERGEKNVSLHTMEIIAAGLGTTVSELLAEAEGQ
jgi:DNA-binding XRE family transcriptional regulator